MSGVYLVFKSNYISNPDFKMLIETGEMCCLQHKKLQCPCQSILISQIRCIIVLPTKSKMSVYNKQTEKDVVHM